jgi:alkyl sulfatase BDS1-like metallo-beta-lactamase superfamily hydrolase
MYGVQLEPGPEGTLGASLGMGTSSGTVTLIPPTVEIKTTGQEEVVDGIRLEFQMTPGTEAPAEMNFHLPDFRAFCIAENATHNLHNVLTLRGALVRDAHMWSKYLGETLTLLRDDVEVMFAGHHWPTWGRENIVRFVAQQRDLYGYLHDQTLRLMNSGFVGAEIAEQIELPPELADEWHCKGFYGSVSHNVKAVYQRYMGWFDGNPAHLWQHPPEEAARRYVEYMGGTDAVVAKAREALDAGDLRWVAEVVNHVVFADPSNTDARDLQAEALTRLGHGSENATWRNFYLTGAAELRGAETQSATPSRPPDLVAGLSSGQLLDAFAIRVDGPKAWGKRVALNWVFPATDERFAVTLENGTLTHTPGAHGSPDATITVNRTALNTGLAGGQPDAAPFEIDGNGEKVAELFGVLDEPDPAFNIVVP